MNLSELPKEFPRAAVHWRVQGKPYERNGTWSAMALAYIDARDVMDRLDEVCGPENWQTRYTETARGRVLCEIGIRIDDQWVWKSDGAGDTAVEGEKGGISDSLKRAAVQWGIGRYLYRLDSPWIRCEVRQKDGKTYWQRWAEDPWNKVKVTGYQKPEEPAVDEADPVDAAIQEISALPSMDALKAHWSKLCKTALHLAENPKVIEAKDARKAEIEARLAA